MRKQRPRWFIIGPTGGEESDTLYIVATHTTHKFLIDVYQLDLYVEQYRTGSVEDAIRYAKKHGAKRPTII
jgi:hypothetical protein